MSITVVIPSRGRPERARLAVESIRDTAVRVRTSVIVAIDYDDPRRDDYRRTVLPRFGVEATLVVLSPDETGNLVKATNTPAMRVAKAEPDSIIGVLNDDMLARTTGWDRVIEEHLATPGIAYGDDLFQHDALVTSPFMTADIPLALGWYALPALEHLFIDNVWRDIGEGAGILTYLPDLVFEHVHPFAGKAEWDETYEHGNAQPVIDRDRTTYEWWRDRGMRDADIARVRSALSVAA